MRSCEAEKWPGVQFLDGTAGGLYSISNVVNDWATKSCDHRVCGLVLPSGRLQNVRPQPQQPGAISRMCSINEGVCCFIAPLISTIEPHPALRNQVGRHCVVEASTGQPLDKRLRRARPSAAVDPLHERLHDKSFVHNGLLERRALEQVEEPPDLVVHHGRQVTDARHQLGVECRLQPGLQQLIPRQLATPRDHSLRVNAQTREGASQSLQARGRGSLALGQLTHDGVSDFLCPHEAD